jgi:hypothetical protein
MLQEARDAIRVHGCLPYRRDAVCSSWQYFFEKPYAHREADVNNLVSDAAHIPVLPNIKHPITDLLRSIQQRRRRKNRNANKRCALAQ